MASAFEVTIVAEVTSVALRVDDYGRTSEIAETALMHIELAPLRRAQELLCRDEPVAEVVAELRRLFGLDFVGATAAVAAATLLRERDVPISDEPFVRPYMRSA